MHVLRAAALALLATAALVPATAIPAARPALAAEALDVDGILAASGLDEVFTQFGAGIADGPALQGIPFPGNMGAKWTEAANEVFIADEMHAELSTMMRDMLPADLLPALSAFYGSDFGGKVTEIERAVVLLDAPAQVAAHEAGLSLLARLPADSPRGAAVDELLGLVGSEITNAMMAESIRGMLIGLTLSGQQEGDIRVPWDEIDSQLQLMMPGLLGELRQSQQAIAHFTYQSLTDAEFEQYLAFLRTPEAQKFYAVAALAIGKIVHARMSSFGETLAKKLGAVAT